MQPAWCVRVCVRARMPVHGKEKGWSNSIRGINAKQAKPVCPLALRGGGGVLPSRMSTCAG